jgi:fused signal recognition particle receptor
MEHPKAGNQFSAGLARTRDRLAAIFGGGSNINSDFYNDLEDALILADVGLETAVFLINQLRQAAMVEKLETALQLKERLITEITTLFTAANETATAFSFDNSILLITGVNGVGKTTTIAKLAALAKAEGNSPLLIPGGGY